tara:strand:+ start:428 stop:1894 length:1467 start_codon:yes stop_codon:yes gene_type:complete
MLAYLLKQKLDCKIYAIIDVGENPKDFFLNQKLVDFEKVWFFHDNISDPKSKKPDLDYLENIEQRYEINFWKLAINERTFYRFFDFHKFTDDEILSIEEQSCKLFEQVLTESKPEFIISMDSRFHHLEIFQQMCQKLNLNLIIPSFPNVGYRVLLSKYFLIPDNIDELNETTIEKKNFSQLQEYLNNQNILEQRTKYDDTYGGNLINKINAGIEYFLISKNKTAKTHYNYYGRTKYKVLNDVVKTKLEVKKRKDFMDNNLLKEIPLNENFLYFPLNVELEKNMLINSPLLNYQTEIIRYLAKAVPVNLKIYAKEHPGQLSRNWRSIDDYNEIKDIPNVKLFHPDVKSSEMIRQCDIVASIVGTPGFEAAVYEKPSIVFTKTYYSVLPSVTYVDEINNLNEIIRKSLKIKVNADDVNRYLTFFHNNTFSFDWDNFVTTYQKAFYLSGNLVDVQISEQKMKNFIEENRDQLDILVNEFVKKINSSSPNSV